VRTEWIAIWTFEEVDGGLSTTSRRASSSWASQASVRRIQTTSRKSRSTIEPSSKSQLLHVIASNDPINGSSNSSIGQGISDLEIVLALSSSNLASITPVGSRIINQRIVNQLGQLMSHSLDIQENSAAQIHSEDSIRQSSRGSSMVSSNTAV